jgi:hypothetical protein
VHWDVPLAASLATDGNRGDKNKVTNEIDCAHTTSSYSYWGMEFERFAEVAHVIIFF